MFRLMGQFGISSTLLAASSLGSAIKLGSLTKAAGATYEKRLSRKRVIPSTSARRVSTPAIGLSSGPVTIILAPVAQSVGVNPVHFTVMFLIGASIGFIAPPYGLDLCVVSGVTGVPYFRLLKYGMPYFAALISVWIVVAMTPELAAILLPNR